MTRVCTVCGSLHRDRVEELARRGYSFGLIAKATGLGRYSIRRHCRGDGKRGPCPMLDPAAAAFCAFARECAAAAQA